MKRRKLGSSSPREDAPPMRAPSPEPRELEMQRPKKQFSIDGQVERIRMVRFVTYDDVSFFPDPHLNLICGPNGTGKSTVVCGICLGLAGSTKSLGRADRVCDYVKRGQN